MTHQRPLIQQILDKTLDLTGNGKLVLAVFDLDSTLFDVAPRLEKILMDFADIPENQQKFPDQVKHFKNIKVERRDWGIRDALIRAGLDGNHPEFEEKVREFWRNTFFSNEYLQYDIPYPGAVKYVQALSEAGAEIAYLTGRDVFRMGKGSREILLKWDFPLDDKKSHLVLKPHRSMDDGEFKKDWFKDIKAEKYEKIWFFENEPVNIHLVQQHTPHVDVIFFDSTHSRKAEPPEDISTIIHFLLDEH